MLNQKPTCNQVVCNGVGCATVRSKLTTVLLAVFVCLSLCALPACSSSENTSTAKTTNESITNQITVTMQVNLDAVDSGKTISRQVTVAEGATVFDVLNASGVAFNAEDSSYGMYVTSIDGVAQGEYGAQSGWMYTVNGESLAASIDTAMVAADNQIVFTYVTEFAAE